MINTRHLVALLGVLAVSSVVHSASADEPSDWAAPPGEPAAPPAPAPAEAGPATSPPPDAVPARQTPSDDSWRAPKDLPPLLPYRAGRKVPAGYEVASVPRTGMVVGGAVIAGGLHLVSMIAAVALDAEAEETLRDQQGGSRTDPEFDNRYTPLFIPVVGPFVAVKTSEASGTGMAILVMNGVAQVTGCALVIAGLAAPKQVLVKQDMPVAVVPFFDPTGGGLAIRGEL